MRTNAKILGIACSLALTFVFGLSGCLWQQGASSEEELAQQVTYQDADTKPQTQPKTQDTQKDSESTESTNATTQKNKKKTTGSKDTAAQNEKSGSNAKK